jgi:subtilisin family serine protease
VIELGFAFACFQDIPSCVWDTAFAVIRRAAPDQRPVVVSPAGNQRLTARFYPAALNENPGGFPEMIGVGSIDPTGFLQEPFSNRGSWVVCSANGNDVASTFLEVIMPVEDWRPPWWQFWRSEADAPPIDFSSGWAMWDGTSFAAPKVAGEIACRIAGAGSPLQAWNELRTLGRQDPDNQLGLIFPF